MVATGADSRLPTSTSAGRRIISPSSPTTAQIAATGCGPAKIMRSTASKLIRPGGDRVKTDARDATHLTRLLRLGEITAVTVPEREVEAVRDLVRAREDAHADLMRVRHR